MSLFARLLRRWRRADRATRCLRCGEEARTSSAFCDACYLHHLAAP